jgi:hypothetical protein
MTTLVALDARIRWLDMTIAQMRTVVDNTGCLSAKQAVHDLVAQQWAAIDEYCRLEDAQKGAT